MPDYDELTVDELSDIAQDRDLEVEGTGTDGNVLKRDLVEALQASDPVAPTTTQTPDQPVANARSLADVAVQRAARPVRDRSDMFTTETQE